jgi:SAM-dependent methyltransferase
VYDAVALARLPHVPLPTASADTVVSAHVIGHLTAPDTDALLAEVHRVLRPGGRTVHIIETDSEHPAVVAAKQHEGAYRDRFVDQHGHIGLEPAAAVVDRFTRAGFRVTRTDLVEAIVPSAQNTRTFFDHPDFAALPQLRTSRRLERVAAKGGAPNLAYEVAMGTFHRTVEQWFGKPARAQFIHLVAQREP